ncbi:MAG: hypothetical protein QGF09_10240 [Rhodospirillales bacterium]|jgi:hypothetical protein|nr:hypothetical protein [Rhodospirillales bacterium]
MKMFDNFKEGIQQIIQLALLLIPLAIVIQILFGNLHQFAGSDAIGNLVQVLKTMGAAGLPGLISLGIIIWLFSVAMTPFSRRM